MTMPQRGNSGDVWLTPKHIIDALGKFDLDPCAAPLPRPWETASASFIEADDGLSQEWFGRVWRNPPYGRGIGAWMKKMAEHAKAGGGVSLLFLLELTRRRGRIMCCLMRSVFCSFKVGCGSIHLMGYRARMLLMLLVRLLLIRLMMLWRCLSQVFPVGLLNR